MGSWFGQVGLVREEPCAALAKFEERTKYKPFNLFGVCQARQFKDALNRANIVQVKPLALITIDASLPLVNGFFHWLEGQQGFKVATYSEVESFNNNHNDAQAAHAQFTIPKQEPLSMHFKEWRSN